MFQVTAETTPTTAEVRAQLEEGQFTLTATSYTPEQLLQQLNAIQTPVLRYLPVFTQNGFPDMERKLVEAHRFAEIGGFATADRIGITVETADITAAQKPLRANLIANRDAAVRLARDRKVNTRLFSVNFGEGDASNVLVPANVFLGLLKRHGNRLKCPTVVAQLVTETEQDIAKLMVLETQQELGKVETLVPAALRRKACHALYEHLLHFSRVGFVVLRKDPEARAQFSLNLLRGGATTGPGALDDDDAPVVPEGGDELGVAVPAGNVTEMVGKKPGA